jgi:hypothetical protein
MIMFFAFMMFGLYHVYITNPQAFNTIKMMAIFGLLHAQMFVEHAVTEGKKFWYTCEKCFQKNLVTREKIFSNEHILECNAVYYNLKNEKISKIPFKFSKSMVDEGTIIPNDGFIVTEIKFDTLETVRLTYGYFTQYSMKEMWNLIEKDFVGGYPTRLKCPFMCVEVLYDDNRYDVTGLLKEYLYPGNVILSSQFIRMFMFEHLGVQINHNVSLSLHTVDHDVNMKEVTFDADVDYECCL